MSDEPHLHVGDRVVVHDARPPYDYRAGTVGAVERQRAAAVTYTVRLDDGDVLRPTAELIHPMPLEPDPTCRWCRTRLQYPPEP